MCYLPTTTAQVTVDTLVPDCLSEVEQLSEALSELR